MSDIPEGVEYHSAEFAEADSRLARCPFCGNRVEMMGLSRTKFDKGNAVILWYAFGVRCTQCPANTGVSFDDPERAIAFWNKRAGAKVTAEKKERKTPVKKKEPPKEKPRPVVLELDDDEETLPLFGDED